MSSVSGFSYTIYLNHLTVWRPGGSPASRGPFCLFVSVWAPIAQSHLNIGDNCSFIANPKRITIRCGNLNIRLLLFVLNWTDWVHLHCQYFMESLKNAKVRQTVGADDHPFILLKLNTGYITCCYQDDVNGSPLFLLCGLLSTGGGYNAPVNKYKCHIVKHYRTELHAKRGQTVHLCSEKFAGRCMSGWSTFGLSCLVLWALAQWKSFCTFLRTFRFNLWRFRVLLKPNVVSLFLLSE